MNRTRIKICGLTRHEDVRHAVRAGADALGFVFHASSPRNVSAAQAVGLRRRMPPFVTSVALFVDPQRTAVERVLEQLRPGLLQFHGSETAGFCEQFACDYIKVLHLPMAGAQQVQGAAARESLQAELGEQIASHPNAAGFLLDTLSGRAAGGTGEKFDHSLWPSDCERPLVLAGGLRAENVGDAIAHCRPWAVDVSSGVESAPGIKDAEAIEKFVAAVQQACC